MTRTEVRLADALAACADTVREESLQPLPADLQAGPGDVAGGRAWSRLVVPLAAAAAVAVILAVALGVGHLIARSAERPFADAAKPGSPPPYVVDIEGSTANVVTVRATASLRVTDRLPAPRGWHKTGKNAWVQGYEPSALASAADRLFVVSYNNLAHRRTGLFTFGITRSGKVAGLELVPGGILPGLIDISLAVSPDRSKVAVAGLPAPSSAWAYPRGGARIVVLDLRTGARTVWRGGATMPGRYQFSIPSLTWSADGRSLYYVAQWCKPLVGGPGANVQCTSGNTGLTARDPVTQVRDLLVTGHGGQLSSARVLLRDTARFPHLLGVAALRSGALLILARHKTQPYLLRLAPGLRGQPAVIYDRQWLDPTLKLIGCSYASLAVDRSGRYEIIVLAGISGWIHDHTFHWLAQDAQSPSW